MEFSTPLTPATLIRRYKRFLADVQMEDKRTFTVHTANTGAMTGCAVPGSRIWLRNSQNPSRKYPWSWELSSSSDGILIGINTHLANVLVEEAINNGVITELQGYTRIRREVKYGDENSRIDFRLEHGSRVPCYVEVKSVTLVRQAGMAEFPDAVSARGSKHLRELIKVRQEGNRAVLVFCVQRDDARQVRVAADIDPLYAQTLKQAYAMGVELLAYQASVTTKAIRLLHPIPFNL
jgi:sugar fermentation stimulation protein A